MAKLHDIDVNDYLASCLDIEPTAIQEEYVRAGADIAYWNRKRAEAMKAFRLAELATKRIKARLRMELRETLTAAHGKATESMVDSAVETHDEYLRACEAQIEAECEYEKLRGDLDGVKKTKDMLVSMGADMREEMRGDFILREQRKGARIVREGE